MVDMPGLHPGAEPSKVGMGARFLKKKKKKGRGHRPALAIFPHHLPGLSVNLHPSHFPAIQIYPFMDPFTITTGVISVANGTFTLTTNFWKLKNVEDDLKICLQLILMMNKDINGARRLRSQKFPRHHSQPTAPDSLLDRANSAIKDLEMATNKMSKSIEGVRVEKEVDNSISIPQRFSWVFNMKNNFTAQQWVVTAAHARVMSAIMSMESLPDAENSAPPPTYEQAIRSSPSQMRALRGKSTAIVVMTERAKSAGELCAFVFCLRGFVVIFSLQNQTWTQSFPPHDYSLMAIHPARFLHRRAQSTRVTQTRIW